jgi:hypothetical protein
MSPRERRKAKRSDGKLENNSHRGTCECIDGSHFEQLQMRVQSRIEKSKGYNRGRYNPDPPRHVVPLCQQKATPQYMGSRYNSYNVTHSTYCCGGSTPWPGPYLRQHKINYALFGKDHSGILIHVLLTRSLFGDGIPHRLLLRVSLAKPTSAPLRF